MNKAYVLHVFTDDNAQGNPAAVVILDTWLSMTELSLLSCKLAQPVTAFIRPLGADYEIRWFASDIEINLCGHGSLAAAASLFAIDPAHKTEINFISQHGTITVNKQAHGYTMLMPSWKAERTTQLGVLVRDLGLEPVDVFNTRDLVVVLRSAQQVAEFKPDFSKIANIKQFHALIVTAQHGNAGYVLRYFAPSIGINEDIATGSAQCSLVSYWTDKLDQETLQVSQLSEQGGYFQVAKKNAETIELAVNVQLTHIVDLDN